jgi:hypothetical protein
LLFAPLQVICEFLEHAAPAAAAANSSSSSSAAIDPLLTLGAVRVLGRFLADVPDAHQEALRKLLPQLLALHMLGQEGQNVNDQGAFASGAVCFLLPALLCWTAPSNGSQQQWTAVLLAPGSGCLQALAGFASGAVAAAAALAGSLAAAGQLVTSGSSSSRSSSSSGALDELRSVESQLGTACQVLHQLLASLPAARSQQQQQQQGMGPTDLREEHLQQLTLLLQQLGSWAAVRHNQQQQQQQQLAVDEASTTTSAAVSTAAAFLQSVQTVWLELPVLLPAAALTGQLLTLLAAKPVADAGREYGGATLLAWGCEAGWSYQLLNMSQQQEQYAGGSFRRGSSGLQELLMQLQDAWMSADLGEVWDACLSAGADLLVEGQCSSLLQVLAGAAWMQEAAHTVAAMDASVAAGRSQQLAAAVTQTVLEDNMALQLLARAMSRA